MKHLLLFIIQLYWNIFPEAKRKKCIFKKSCSKYVFEITKKYGLIKGLKALLFRYKNCRNGFEIFKNPITNETQMLLITGKIISKNEISKRFLKT